MLRELRKYIKYKCLQLNLVQCEVGRRNVLVLLIKVGDRLNLHHNLIEVGGLEIS